MDISDIHIALLLFADASEIRTVRDRIVDYPKIATLDPPYHVATHSRLTVQEKLKHIQNYIQRLEYNYTGMQFFDLNTTRPICGLMDTARHMYAFSRNTTPFIRSSRLLE